MKILTLDLIATGAGLGAGVSEFECREVGLGRGE